MSTNIIIVNNRSISTKDRIEEIVLKNDSTEISRRELALSVGLHSYELAMDERIDFRHASWAVVCIVVAFISYIFGAF